MIRRFVVVVALLCTLMLSMGATASAASKPHKASPTTPACTYTAWYQVRGPTSGYGTGSSFNISLYALKDIYSGTFCDYLYAGMNYSENSGVCSYFEVDVVNRAGAIFAANQTNPPCGSHGSITTPWTYLGVYDSCWHAEGYINGVYKASTGCYAV